MDRGLHADACRRAGLEFMNEVFDEAALARWLRGYETLSVAPRTPLPPAVFSRELPSIRESIRAARSKVFAALEQAASGRARFVQQIAGELLIARDAEVGWVPVSRPDAPLRGRVLSLFAVDCLFRPADYHTLLLACPDCESIVFDPALRARGRCCAKPASESGERSLAPAPDLRRTR